MRGQEEAGDSDVVLNGVATYMYAKDVFQCHSEF